MAFVYNRAENWRNHVIAAYEYTDLGYDMVSPWFVRNIIHVFYQ